MMKSRFYLLLLASFMVLVGTQTFAAINSPVDISGCELWLDGADPNGDGSDASGALATWKDKSGSDNDATQADTAKQATVTAAGLNSRSVVTFDGSNDTYTFPAMDNVSTVFWVLQETNQVTGDTGHFLMGDISAYDFHRGTDVLWDSGYANSNITSGKTRVDGTDFDANNTNIPADKFITISLVTTGPVHAGQLTQDRDIGRVWCGDIAEVIIYNKALTAQEVADVEDYLHTKWFVATYPTAEVRGGDNNNLVQNGSTSASIDNGTDFGTALTGSSPVAHTFTIKNTGNLDLNLTDTPAVSISGDSAFSISAQPSSTTIAGGASTTFSVSFNPSADGNYTATVSFGNNDTTANPYTFVVKGSASSSSAPAIQVLGNGNLISNGSLDPDSANNTDFGVVTLNTSVALSYTIGNSGNDTLTLTGNPIVGISGSNDFAVTQQPAKTTLAPGETTTFSITFNPTSESELTADVEIASDDPNNNPFKFKIKGTGAVGAGGIGPGGVPNCIMWLDANDPLNDGSTPVAGPTDIWKDRSGANNDAVQGETGNKPSLATNEVNGKAVFKFDGSTQFFNLEDFENIVTAFWVVRETDHDNPHFLLGGTDTYDFHRGFDAEIGNIWSSATADVITQGVTKLDGSVVDGVSTQLPADGDYHILSVVATGPAKANTLSKDRDIPDRNWKGEMAEVILFDRALSDSEVQSIEDYLNSKWMESSATPSINVKGRNIGISNGSTTISTNDDTDYGDTKIGFPNTHTFTIANTGSGDLDISKIEITGADAGEFRITSSLPTTIPSAEVATLDIAFDPTTEGDKTATVSIESNDTENSPYTFVIGGLASVAKIPVIVVKGGEPLQEIENGDTIPDVNDNTNFGTLNLSEDEPTVTKEFTIENQGNTVLHLDGGTPVSVLGSNASFYTLSGPEEINIEPDSSTTFSVTFAPETPGRAYPATVRVVCDDPSNNPYEFAITGDTANPPPDDPAIKVSGNGENIPNDSSHVPNIEDNTDFGQVEIGQTVTHTFTIMNSGSGDLNIDGIRTTGDGFSASIEGDTPITLAPEQTIDFDVTFSASNPAQVVNGSILINNTTRIDDPFAIQIVGEAIEPIEPNVNVVWNGQSIAPNSTPSLTNGTDFGEQTVNEPIEREFQIVNTGNADLNLISNPVIKLSGSAVFKVTQQPARTVIPEGGSITFKIEFLPTTVEQLAATVSFECDVPSKTPYEFTIQGHGIQGSVSSSINVEGNGINIANNDITPILADLTDFGTVNAGSKLAHTFTIKNTSSKELELIGNEVIHISGLSVNDFTVTTKPDSLIKAGDTSKFVITYSPSTLGEATATVTIDNNTAESNPFTFNIHGIGSNGTPKAFMRVIANNELIKNGSDECSIENNTDYGTVDIGVGKELIFQVENAGNDILTFDDPSIEITGNNSTSFTVVQKLTSVQPGETNSFSIKFSPDTVGEKDAIISIANNDTAKDPYTFMIKGIATDPNAMPNITITGNDIEVTNGSTAPSIDNGTDFGNASIGLSVENEFTIFNDSFSTLTLDGSPTIKISGANAADFVVSSQPTSKDISAKSQVQFKIEFKPLTAGNKTAKVTIANNAEDFEFAIAGTTLGNTPIAQADSYTVESDAQLVVSSPGVLSNDTDPNNEPITAIKVTDPTKGIVLLNEDGSFAYTPNAGMTGTDSFTYKAKNASTESQPTTVTIEIVSSGATPVAVDDTYTTTKNAILNIPATGVLENDINGSTETLSATLVNAPATGTLVFNSDGSFSYTPDNQVGVVTFTYTASNGSVTSNAATVTINVNEIGTNNPPVALSDSYSMTQNTTLTISSPGILANDTDAEGDALTAVLVNDVASGALELNANGSFSYIPETDFIGSVVFTYKASDGKAYSNTVTVAIMINATGTNNPPIAVPSNYTVAKDQKLAIPAPGVLSNDMDPDGDALTAVLVGSTSHGQLTLNADGSFEYTASAGYVGSDLFSYKASDGQLSSNIVSVTITIDPNALPGVTEGMLFSSGDSAGKAIATYVDPVKGRSRTLRIKSVDSKLLWNKPVTLYNKSDYRYSLHKGNPTSNWIKANPIKQLDCAIYAEGSETPWHIGINPPELSSIERWDGSDFTNGIHTNSVFVLKGKYFGTKIPRVTLEYIDSKKNVKQVRLKVDKNDLLYANYKGKEGCSPMDPETGISELRVALPGKNFTAKECWVVLVNKTGIAADVETKTLPSFTLTSGNTPPIANDDSFVLEGGQKSYMLDVLANDTDAESDNVVIMPSGKTSSNGGKLKVLGYRIQYTPKGAGSGDSFTYTIDDGHGGQSTATVTIK